MNQQQEGAPGRRDERIADEYRDRDGDADRRRIAFAEARDHRPDDEALPERDGDADRGKARADHPRRPAELRDAVEAPRHRIDEAGDLPQQQHRRRAAHARQRAHRANRAKRIGAAPVEAAPFVGGQRLWKDEGAVDHVRRREQRRRHKGRARRQLAQKAADRGADDEADTEGGADETEVASALLRPRDIGDRRHRGGIATPENSRQRAREEQPGQRVDDRQQCIVGGESGK